MSQRKDHERKASKEPDDSFYDKGITHFRKLRRTHVIKKDLDRHLLMLDIIPTTHKTELQKLVKK